MNSNVLTVNVISNHNVLELHLVASQSPSLISHDILNLAEFLIDTYGSALESPLIESTKHLLIFGHEGALKHFDKLKGDDKADGNKSTVEDKVRSKGYSSEIDATNFLTIY